MTRHAIYFSYLLLACFWGPLGCGSTSDGEPSQMGPDAGPGEPQPDAAPPSEDAPDAALPEPDATPPELPPIGELGTGVATLAGHGVPGATDGPREQALFNNPANVAVGPNGNVYVADFDNHLIRRISATGDVTTLTKQDDFKRPFGLVFDPQGRLFVQTDANDSGQANVDTGTLWEVALDTGVAQVIARDLGRPRGLGALSDGTLVLVDNPKHAISLLDPDDSAPIPTLLAGTPGEAGHLDDTGVAARFHRPLGVVIDSRDNIYVADRENHCIRKLGRDGVVTTLTGNPGVSGDQNGFLDEARFNRPNALAIDGKDIIYVTELDGYHVRAIDIDGDEVFTVAGLGSPGFVNHEDPMQAQFFGLEGLAADPSGNYLYIADGSRGQEPAEDYPYHRVRRVSLTEEATTD